SQLLEEELRNRDRNAALIALEEEIERYRPYLGLTPDEALARSRTAAPAEKRLLQKLAGAGWGPLQMYRRLSREELAALCSGQQLRCSAEPQNGGRMLPPEVARGVLQSMRDRRIRKFENVNFGDRNVVFAGTDAADPEGRPLTAVPEVRGRVTLSLEQSELGQFTLNGRSGIVASASPGRRPPDHYAWDSDNPLAVGRSPAAVKPEDGVANTRLARDPTLRTRVTLRLRPACGSDLSRGPSPTQGGELPPLPAPGRGARGEVNPKVTGADVLEALHQATGLPIAA